MSYRLEPTTAAPFAEYRDDPVGFCHEVLGDKMWGPEDSRTGNPGQQGVLRAMVEHDNVSWPKPRGAGGTMAVARIILWWLNTRFDSMVVTTAPTENQVKHQTWAAVRNAYKRSRKRLPGSMSTMGLKLDEEWYGIGLSPNVPENIQGFHARGGVLFIADEAMTIPDSIFTAADGYGTTAGCKQLYVFNPTRRSGRAFEVSRDPERHDFFVPKMTAFDAPEWLISDKWLEVHKRKYRGDTASPLPAYYSYMLGEFPPHSDNSLVSLDQIEQSEWITPIGLRGRRMGVDIADGGADYNVAVCIENGRVVGYHRWKGVKTMPTVARILTLMDKWGVRAGMVGIDCTGVGAGVGSRLHELNHNVVEVKFGNPVTYPYPGLVPPTMRFNSNRASLLWLLRVMLEEDQISIPAKYSGISNDLQAIEYFKKGDVTGMLSKAELKKILGRSTDDLDAVLCAIAVGEGNADDDGGLGIWAA